VSWLASFPLLALLVALQTSFVPSLRVGPAIPELVVVWVICWAVIRGRAEALPWALAGGLMLDLLSALPPGSHLLALALVAYLADLGHRFMEGSTALFVGLAVVLGSILYGSLLLLASGFGTHRAELVTMLGGQVLPTAAYNLVLTVPVFLVLRWLDRRFPVPVLPDW
jgi:rod shape-determining protein MreD